MNEETDKQTVRETTLPDGRKFTIKVRMTKSEAFDLLVSLLEDNPNSDPTNKESASD